jgi:hypothetical protein
MLDGTYETSLSAAVGGGTGGTYGPSDSGLPARDIKGVFRHTLSRTSCSRRFSSSTFRSNSATKIIEAGFWPKLLPYQL